METPTTYDDIFDVFLSQISDSTFINIPTVDLTDLMQRYLQNAIPKFRRCKQDLTNRDDINATFNITLTDEEQLILGYLMVIEYLSPRIYSIELIKQSMSNRDFTITSQANHLKQLQELKNNKQREVSKLIVDYTYNNNDLSGLK